MEILLVSILVLFEGRPVPKAFVTCEGFVNYNDDVSFTREPMRADSRGVVFIQDYAPIDTTCQAWKDELKGSVRVYTDKDARFVVHVKVAQ